ncbi:MAG: membrane protein insertion efficiency factor YidD [Spirochaetales bacterium]|nr:membrane protein insertion efficiency factor YidD [Spirochaetales bacterium]
MSMKKKPLLSFLLLISLSTLYCDELDDLAFILYHNPVVTPKTQTAKTDYPPLITNDVTLVAYGLFGCYKLLFSGQSPPSCLFIPSCSEYTMEAIRVRGIISGILAGADRLLRCNNLDMEYYPRDIRSGKFLDPVERNPR